MRVLPPIFPHFDTFIPFYFYQTLLWSSKWLFIKERTQKEKKRKKTRPRINGDNQQRFVLTVLVTCVLSWILSYFLLSKIPTSEFQNQLICFSNFSSSMLSLSPPQSLPVPASLLLCLALPRVFAPSAPSLPGGFSSFSLFQPTPTDKQNCLKLVP